MQPHRLELDGTYPDLVKSFVEDGLWQGRKRFSECAPIAVANANGIVAGVVFDNFDHEAGTIEMSVYSTSAKWMNKRILCELFDFAFNKAGARIVVARHSAKNRQAVKIWNQIGAEKYLVPKLWRADEDMEFAVLRREKWFSSQWVKGK